MVINYSPWKTKSGKQKKKKQNQNPSVSSEGSYHESTTDWNNTEVLTSHLKSFKDCLNNGCVVVEARSSSRHTGMCENPFLHPGVSLCVL